MPVTWPDYAKRISEEFNTVLLVTRVLPMMGTEIRTIYDTADTQPFTFLDPIGCPLEYWHSMAQFENNYHSRRRKSKR